MLKVGDKVYIIINKITLDVRAVVDNYAKAQKIQQKYTSNSEDYIIKACQYLDIK